nr:ATP synthase CF1 beta subunit [Cordia dichotoma]
MSLAFLSFFFQHIDLRLAYYSFLFSFYFRFFFSFFIPFHRRIPHIFTSSTYTTCITVKGEFFII